MHDCRKMESKLIDLVFDELDADEKLRLVSEIEACDDCSNEYRSMTGTLLICDEAFAASSPDESFWLQHHASLRQRLEAPQLRVMPKRESFWKRVLQARLPVPVPIAAAIVIALLISSVLALRPSTTEAVPAPAQTPIVMTAPPEIIRVPVVQERVVTRTVYVEKKVREKNETRRQPQSTRRDDAMLTARQDEREGGQAGFFTSANLTDFQPADDMKIRIVKRSNSDEN